LDYALDRVLDRAGEHLAVGDVALAAAGAGADALDGEGRLPADVATNEAVRSLLTTALDGQFCESDGYDSGADDRPWH
jgi:hypothetical protein